jgi:TolB protein
VEFALRAASVASVDSVSIVVNGKTIRSLGPLAAGEARTFTGRIAIPAGGWIGARAVGPKISQWPAMAEYAFAQTAPVWIGQKGSTDPAARRAAAADLLRALEAAERRLVAGYAGAEIPKLRAHIAETRGTLEGLAK